MIHEDRFDDGNDRFWYGLGLRAVDCWGWSWPKRVIWPCLVAHEGRSFRRVNVEGGCERAGDAPDFREPLAVEHLMRRLWAVAHDARVDLDVLAPDDEGNPWRVVRDRTETIGRSPIEAEAMVIALECLCDVSPDD